MGLNALAGSQASNSMRYNKGKECKECKDSYLERIERMEIAKITSKGQITLPIGIRRKLSVKEGDQVLFVEDGGRIYLLNSSMVALLEAQKAFAGEAERAGLNTEDDVVSMVKDIRKKRMTE